MILIELFERGAISYTGAYISSTRGRLSPRSEQCAPTRTELGSSVVGYPMDSTVRVDELIGCSNRRAGSNHIYCLPAVQGVDNASRGLNIESVRGEVISFSVRAK
jgi:hypothetical protein